jgi:hypothetical protein
MEFPIHATWMNPFTGVKLIIGWGSGISGYSKQVTESIKGIKPPVKPKSELIEVGLEVLLAKPMIDASQPSF